MDSKNRQCRRKAEGDGVYCHLHHKCPESPLSGYEPTYEPDRYNKNPLVQHTHNCWAYSLNVLDPKQLLQCDGGRRKGCDLMYHQPGGTKGLAKLLRTRKGRRCSVVERLMRADVPEIRKTTFRARCPAGTSKIAMVVAPGDDYHFLRQDSHGWSEKGGSNKTKQYDAEGKPTVNPQTAARDYRPRSYLNYKDFCGFYCVPRVKPVRLARDE